MATVNDFISKQAAQVRIDRLKSMRDYAQSSLEAHDLWDRVYALSQMLQGELSRQEQSQDLAAYRNRKL